MRVFVDVNVLIDLALERSGFFESSRAALVRCQDERHTLLLAWHTISNVFYILRRVRGREWALDFVRDMVGTMQVAAVGHADAIRALEQDFSDIEDALQFAAAQSAGADVILTRNPRDFRTSQGIRVMTPEEYLETTLP